MSEITYTDSAIVDKIAALLKKKKYIMTLESFKYNTSGTFLFNPLDDDEINDIFLKVTDEFPAFVKKAIVQCICSDWAGELAYKIRQNLKVQITPDTKIRLNEWSAKHEGIPISADCVIIGALESETEVKSADTNCMKCGHVEKIYSLDQMPIVCENKTCTSRKFRLDQSTVRSEDIRTIIVQEPPEEVRHGAPVMRKCHVRGELIFDAYSGQKKTITGVFRSMPQKGKSTSKIVINVISMQSLDDDRMMLPDETKARQLETMAKKPNYVDILCESFAPEIKFRKMEKTAIMLSLVGSTKRDGKRNNINCLLSGNPGTSKSKMLKYIQKVKQKSGFVDGASATGAGITIALTTLPDGTKFPKAGVVSECSGSALAMDEIKLFPADDLGRLYEVMEYGEMHYNKAGFNQKVKADTTIIAGANPQSGYYVNALGMVKNLGLPPPLISRFDLKVNVLSESSELESQQISDHINLIDSIGTDRYVERNSLLAASDMMLLVNHAQTFQTTLSADAQKMIDDFFKTMIYLQTSEEQEDGAPKFDRRLYETIVRVAEAFARLHFRTEVTREFTQMAIDFMKSTLESFGLRTDRELRQVPLENEDIKDKEKAFDMCWAEMVKDAGTEMLPEHMFVKFLVEKHPTLFDEKRGSKLFDARHQKGDLIKVGTRFKMT